MGAGVDWVFGFVTPMTIATNSVHTIGMAQGRLSDGKRQFAGTPGLLTLSCELAFLQKRLHTAENDCKAAVAAMDEQPRAHYLLAHNMVPSAGLTVSVVGYCNAVALIR